MIRIEMTPYEQKDILEVLDYAIGQYFFSRDPMRKYWLMRINQLKKVIEGRVNPPSMERR